MATTRDDLYDGSVFRPSKPVHLEAGRRYTIIVTTPVEDSDVANDPAFNISSLAGDTGISDPAIEHEQYLYGKPEVRMHEE